jgi:hypothetical protein
MIEPGREDVQRSPITSMACTPILAPVIVKKMKEVTNGTSWLVFRLHRKPIPLRRAIVDVLLEMLEPEKSTAVDAGKLLAATVVLYLTDTPIRSYKMSEPKIDEVARLFW